MRVVEYRSFASSETSEIFLGPSMLLAMAGSPLFPMVYVVGPHLVSSYEYTSCVEIVRDDYELRTEIILTYKHCRRSVLN